MHPAAHKHRGLEEDLLRCTVYEQSALQSRHVEEQRPRNLACVADNYGPTVFLVGNQDAFFSDRFTSGVTSLNIPTKLVSAHLQVDLDTPLSEMIVVSHGDGGGEEFAGSLRGANDNNHALRTNSKFEGTFEVLVVRVSDKSGNSPTHSAEELSKHIFTDDITMVSIPRV